MKKILLFLLAVLIPALACAGSDLQAPALSSILNPPPVSGVGGIPTDLSLQYLAMIFGVVDGVLHGSGTQIMGQMFKIFNLAALAIGGIIVIYTLLVSTLNTAHEGEIMGKQWSSIWIPVRTVAGIALLFPKASGYSMIQIFFMWVIVQGIGAADSIWGSALTYLSTGGVIVVSPQPPAAQIVEPAKDIFRSEVCIYALQKGLNNGYRTANEQVNINQAASAPTSQTTIAVQPSKSVRPAPVPNLSSTFMPFPDRYCTGPDPTIDCKDKCDESGKCTVYFPGDFWRLIPQGNQQEGAYDYNKLTGICGKTTWNNVKKSDIEKGPADAGMFEILKNSRQIAMQQLVMALAAPAGLYVNNRLVLTTDKPPVNPDTAPAPDPLWIINATSQYQGIMQPVINTMSRNSSRGIESKFYTDAYKTGWILAGKYYLDLAGVNRSFQDASKIESPAVTSKDDLYNQLSGAPGSGYGIDNRNKGALIDVKPSFLTDSDATSITQFFRSKDTELGPPNVFLKGITAQAFEKFGGADKYSQTQNRIAAAMSGGGGGGFWLSLIPGYGPMLQVITGLSMLRNAQANNQNPIVMIAIIGDALINFVIQVWIGGAIAVGAMALLGLTFCGTGVPGAANPLINWIVPLVWFACSVLLVNGAVMAFYIPMIPYLLFTFGAIGWIMLVIEAIVAAPIVALGLTHPEGHAALGRADTGVMLLLSVFLRPSMMIIGFIAAIIISYIGIWLLNEGFWYAFGNIVDKISLSFLTIIFAYLPATLIIYVTAVIAIINMSFTLIVGLGDRVMKWLSIQAEQLGGAAEKGAQAVEGGVQGAAKGVGELGGRVVERHGDKKGKGASGGGEGNEGGPTAKPS